MQTICTGNGIDSYFITNYKYVPTMNLFTAKKYQVELTDNIVFPGDSKDAFSIIFNEFEVSTNADNDFDNEYDLYRSELVKLRNEIKNRTEYFKEREDLLNEQLATMEIGQSQFVAVLDKLIDLSDPENEMVLLCWM